MMVDNKVLIVSESNTHGVLNHYDVAIIERSKVMNIQPLPDAIFYTWEAFGLYIETHLQVETSTSINISIDRAE